MKLEWQELHKDEKIILYSLIGDYFPYIVSMEYSLPRKSLCGMGTLCINNPCSGLSFNISHRDLSVLADKTEKLLVWVKREESMIHTYQVFKAKPLEENPCPN
jgi:hypothetical protein